MWYGAGRLALEAGEAGEAGSAGEGYAGGNGRTTLHTHLSPQLSPGATVIDVHCPI